MRKLEVEDYNNVDNDHDKENGNEGGHNRDTNTMEWQYGQWQQ
jgi:hypothetical protein